MIIGEIRRYLRDNSAIRVSRSIKDIAYKVLRLSVVYANTNETNVACRRALEKSGFTKINAENQQCWYVCYPDLL